MELDLRFNLLSDTSNLYIFHTMTSLQTLLLSGNLFNGKLHDLRIPYSLTQLDVSGNHFSGNTLRLYLDITFAAPQ